MKADNPNDLPAVEREKWVKYANSCRAEIIELRAKMMQLEAEVELLKAHVYDGRNAVHGEAEDNGGDTDHHHIQVYREDHAA